MVFPVVMYGCESWTVKKAKLQRIDAFELWCWRRHLRVPWTAKRSKQTILKEISLWTEVCDIVQETVIKTIPMEKNCKKAKWLSGEALQIVVKRREVKSKGKKERYKHLNAEFQRTARDKTAFLSDQCKEIEENNTESVNDKSWKAMPKNAQTTAQLHSSHTLVK